MPDPTLHTERLTLRPLTAARARDLLAAPSAGFPTDDDAHVLRGVVADGEHARGSYVLERAGRPIGTAGAVGPPSPDGDQEIGFGLAPQARGQGLGTEAVAALAAVLEQGEGVRRLTAEVLPGNTDSLRLLRRLGFVDVEGGTGGRVLLARSAPGQPALRARIAGRHVC